MNHNDLNQCRLDVERLRKAADRLVELKAERDKMLVELRFTVEQLKLIATWLSVDPVSNIEMCRQRALDTIGMMRGWMK
jgi:hypothetical protein